MHIQIIITNCYIIENFIDDSNDNSLEEIELNSRTNFRNFFMVRRSASEMISRPYHTHTHAHAHKKSKADTKSSRSKNKIFELLKRSYSYTYLSLVN